MSIEDPEEEYALEAQVRYPGRITSRTGWLTCIVYQQKSSEQWKGELSFWLTPEACEDQEELVEALSLEDSGGLKVMTISRARKLIAKHFGVAPAKITLSKLKWTKT